MRSDQSGLQAGTMSPEVKLTAYDKQTELLIAEFAVPRRWIAYARAWLACPIPILVSLAFIR